MLAMAKSQSKEILMGFRSSPRGGTIVGVNRRIEWFGAPCGRAHNWATALSVV